MGGREARVDALIFTAADGEDIALANVEDGAIDGTWAELDRATTHGYIVRTRRYRGIHGRPLRIATVHAYGMGEGPATLLAGALIPALKPECVAMCGVCAGNPGDSPERPWTNLGDVIVAELVYKYDRGELVHADGKREAIFNADTKTINLTPQWIQAARAFKPEFLNSPGAACLARRPPLPAGRIAEWNLHVHPLGTGSSLVRDATIWSRLRGAQRSVVGIDMEAAAVGEAAFALNVPHLLVVKGVMDHAEPGRSHGFRVFAAEAAAEVLVAFLRQQLEPTSRGPEDVLHSGLIGRATERLGSGAASEPVGPDSPPERRAAHRPQAASAFLLAGHATVAFDETIRRREIAELESWCADPSPLAMRLFTGPGGAGKTRLFQWWCAQLRDRGWYAGFLLEGTKPDDIDLLCTSERPTCAVIDYAEARSGLAEHLETIAQQASKQGRRFRVILVARQVADWWAIVRDRDHVKPYLDADPIERLSSVEIQENDPQRSTRARVFRDARAAFAAALGKPDPQQEIDLADERFARPLYLHMAALAAVENLDTNPATLLSVILDHERSFWGRGWKQLGADTGGDYEAIAFTEQFGLLVAALTLRNGAATRDEASGLNQDVGGPDHPRLTHFVESLYATSKDAPSETQSEANRIAAGSSLRSPSRDAPRETGYLRGLQPDLLGEALVEQVLASPRTPSRFLEQALQSASDEQIKHALTVLGRIALRSTTSASRWMERVIRADVPGRALPAMLAATALAERSAEASLGQTLWRVLEDAGEGVPIESMMSNLPAVQQTVSLREVAEWVVRRAREALPGRQSTESDHLAATRGRLAGEHAGRLSELGRREEALAAAEEGVGLMLSTLRFLPPAVVVPRVIKSLQNLLRIAEEAQRNPAELPAVVAAIQVLQQLGVVPRQPEG